MNFILTSLLFLPPLTEDFCLETLSSWIWWLNTSLLVFLVSWCLTLVLYMCCFPYICTWLSLITRYTYCKHSHPVMSSSTCTLIICSYKQTSFPQKRFTQGSHKAPYSKMLKNKLIFPFQICLSLSLAIFSWYLCKIKNQG